MTSSKADVEYKGIPPSPYAKVTRDHLPTQPSPAAGGQAAASQAQDRQARTSEAPGSAALQAAESKGLGSSQSPGGVATSGSRWRQPETTPMLRRRVPRPRQGWQALAYDFSGGRWNPGLSEKERKVRDREQQIATQLRGKHVTAFFCLKGGISKTSTTAATSIALANLRPDPVFAVDANPDAGDLVERLVGERQSGITALAAHVDEIDSLDALSRYTVTAGRLTVLPGEPNPILGDSLGAEDFERIMGAVQRYYSFVQVDCGTGVTHPLMSGILRFADTAVIPAAWSITGAKRAAETIQWLEDNGFAELARTSIVVLTAKDLVSRNVDKDAVLGHLSKAGDLVVVPADPHVADGALLDWEHLQLATQEAYLEIAAAITRRFEAPVPAAQL